MTPQGGALLGIDFGTTHTVAVVGQTPLLFDASPLLVSAVAATADGTLLTGRDALRGALQDPSRFEPNPKLRVDDGRVLLGGVEFDVEDVVAAPLRRVAQEAARVLGGPPERTVLTYPASWAARRRDVLLRAADRAGLAGVTLVPEPVAAAVHHALGLQRPVPAGGVVAVYDLGGGTFDVTLLRHDGAADRAADGTADRAGWRVLATTGLEDVGGIDLDAALVGYFGATVGAREPRRWRRLVEPTDAAGRRVLQSFRDDVRGAKEQLSRATSAVVRVPGFEIDGYLSREELEAVVMPWLVRTVDVLAALTGRAGVRRLDGLYLVGGSSRIPLVATLLHRRFEVAPTLVEQPELVVALGSVQVPAGPVPVPPDAVHPSTPASPAGPSAADIDAGGGAGTSAAGWPLMDATATAQQRSAAPSPMHAAPAAAPPADAATSTATAPPPPNANANATPGGPPPQPANATPGRPPMPPMPPMSAMPARAAGSGRMSARGVAVLVVMVLAAFLALQYDWDGAGQANRNSGPTTGAATGNAAGGGKQTLQVGRTAWYAGFRVDFGTATYDPGAEQAVRVELKVNNRGREDADLLGVTVPISVRFGDRTTQGSYTGSRRVGARSDVEVGVAFAVKGPVNLADGVLTVGGDDRLTAQIPLKAGGSAPPVVGPVQILASATVVTDGLTFKNVTCELRTDFLDSHQQVSAKDRAIGCAFDVSFVGTRYAGVGPDGLRLVMPDGSVRAPQRYPVFHLNTGEERRDELVEFVFGWPVSGSGRFALRVFDGDLRTPDRKDLTLTLP